MILRGAQAKLHLVAPENPLLFHKFTYIPYYLANTPPPPNSFDENYCAGIIIVKTDCD